jgi:hypothetical protein
MNMFLTVDIKDSRGKLVRSFNINGAHNVDQVLLWIWRDLFVSILARGRDRQKEMIPEMLSDIEDVLGWPCLERLLYGGKIGTSRFHISTLDD